MLSVKVDDEVFDLPVAFVDKLLVLKPLDIDFTFKTSVASKTSRTTYLVESRRCTNIIDDSMNDEETSSDSSDIVVSITVDKSDADVLDLDFDQFWEAIEKSRLSHTGRVKSLSNYKFVDVGSNLALDYRKHFSTDSTPTARFTLSTTYHYYNRKKDEEVVKKRNIISTPAYEFLTTNDSKPLSIIAGLLD